VNTFQIVAVSVLALVAAFFVWRHSNKRKADSVVRHIIVQGIGKVSWLDSDGEELNPVLISQELLDVLGYVWPEYQRIYDAPQVLYRCEDIRLNPRFFKVAQYKAASRLMTINPNQNYRRGFGAELHNMFRATLFGINRIYNTEGVIDADRHDRAQTVWKAL